MPTSNLLARLFILASAVVFLSRGFAKAGDPSGRGRHYTANGALFTNVIVTAALLASATGAILLFVRGGAIRLGKWTRQDLRLRPGERAELPIVSSPPRRSYIIEVSVSEPKNVRLAFHAQLISELSAGTTARLSGIRSGRGSMQTALAAPGGENPRLIITADDENEFTAATKVSYAGTWALRPRR